MVPDPCSSPALAAASERDAEEYGAGRTARLPHARTDDPPCKDVYGRTCKRRDCSHCGPSWARNWQTVTERNLAEYGGAVALVSITAPGADVLPWSCSRDHVHGGPRGCTVKVDYADAWAAHAPMNWRKLRDAARRACVRAGFTPTLLERVWEPQKRGVPHLHLVLGVATPAEHLAARRFVDELARLAPDYFFGFVDRRLRHVSAGEAARYLAGYLMGRSRRKGTIRENIADPRMPRSLIWLTPRLTEITHVTMRYLRRARHLIAWSRGLCTPPKWADAIERDIVTGIVRHVFKVAVDPPPLQLTLRQELRLADYVGNLREARAAYPAAPAMFEAILAAA